MKHKLTLDYPEELGDKLPSLIKALHVLAKANGNCECELCKSVSNKVPETRDVKPLIRATRESLERAMKIRDHVVKNMDKRINEILGNVK